MFDRTDGVFANGGYYGSLDFKRYFVNVSDAINYSSTLSTLFAIIGIIFVALTVIYVCSLLQKKMRNFQVLKKIFSFIKITIVIFVFLAIICFLLKIAVSLGLTKFGFTCIVGSLLAIGGYFFLICLIFFGIMLITHSNYKSKKQTNRRI